MVGEGGHTVLGKAGESVGFGSKRWGDEKVQGFSVTVFSLKDDWVGIDRAKNLLP